MNDNPDRFRIGDRLSAVRYWKGRLVPVTELTPLRIALVYTVLGMVGLFVSDAVFVWYFSDPLLSRIQALKGGVEVILTAVFVFVVTSRREAQLQRSMDHLSRQREELQVLHRVLRHNLRNDLNVIQGYVEQIREQVPSARLDTPCTTVLSTVEKMTRYTEQATRIRQITDGQVRTVDLSEMIPELLEGHPQVTGDVDVSTSLPERATIEANPMFREALGELVTNAIVHNDSETPTVSIDIRPENGPPHVLEIRIADDGPGIPQSELEPLRTGEEGQILHLSGMGLWFVEWTVRHSGGELVFEGNEPSGTTVIIRVPEAPGRLSSPLSLLNGA